MRKFKVGDKFQYYYAVWSCIGEIVSMEEDLCLIEWEDKSENSLWVSDYRRWGCKVRFLDTQLPHILKSFLRQKGEL